jgi:hypothetical protein
MRAFVAAVAVSMIMGVGAYFVLGGVQKPAESAFSTSGVRL